MKLGKHPLKGVVLMALAAVLLLTACGRNTAVAAGSGAGSQTAGISGVAMESVVPRICRIGGEIIS